MCTVAGPDAFDQRPEKVTERIRLDMSESHTINVLEDHVGVLWIVYTSGNGLASYDRRTRQLTRYSFKDSEPPPNEISGEEGIHEDADSNLSWRQAAEQSSSKERRVPAKISSRAVFMS